MNTVHDGPTENKRDRGDIKSGSCGADPVGPWPVEPGHVVCDPPSLSSHDYLKALLDVGVSTDKIDFRWPHSTRVSTAIGASRIASCSSWKAADGQHYKFTSAGAARAFRVSRRSMQRADRLLREGAEELAAAALDGVMPLTMAEALLPLCSCRREEVISCLRGHRAKTRRDRGGAV